MGLINLKTDLKDLKFGHDRYKNGNSGEPFIQTRIPATDEPLQTSISVSGNNVVEGLGFALLGAGAGALIGGSTGAIVGASLGVATAVATQGLELQLQTPTAGTGGPDFLLRGGYLASTATINDAIRLSKFFRTTEGVLFTVKQNLLSRIAVKTQGAPRLLNERVYTPFSSILGAVGSSFGLHVNKQGLNPFLGLGETFVPDRYFTAIADNITDSNQTPDGINGNRLYGLYAVKLLGDSALSPFFKNNNISPTDSTSILSYEGGPGAPLGIGKTNIRYATDNTGQPLSVLNTKIKINNTLTYKEIADLTNQYNSSNEGLSTYVGYIPMEGVAILGSVGTSYEIPPLGTHNSSKIGDFRKNLRKATGNGAQFLLNYGTENIEKRTNLGDPGGPGKSLQSYSEGCYYNVPLNKGIVGAASKTSFDKINWSTIYNSSEASTKEELTDLIQFRIGVINNDVPGSKTYMHFRAFLDQISDSYNSNWDATKYIGRGENFYNYSGFDRKVSLGWTVAAQSKAELIPMYRKLNYLASIITPDYSEGGYMRGNLITLTIGGYFYEQPGIITGFNYEMNDENDTWEIAIDDGGGLVDIAKTDQYVKQLPHLIRVKGFNFTPIHRFAPRKQQFSGEISDIDNFGWDPETRPKFGPERYIALENRNTNNYGLTYYKS